MKVCPTCQRHFGDADVFCPHDGARLNAPASLPPGAKTAAPPDPLRFAASIPAAIPTPSTPIPPETPTAETGAEKDPLDEYQKMVGTTLDGRYQIEALLGEGGMGVVFRAHHAVIEKTVAIKLLKREVIAEESVVARFLQEAKAASRIGHPNIVDVTDFGTLPDGLAYFVMEFIAGKTLAHVLYEQSPLPIHRTLSIVGQLARALGAAHARGVIHRDLKPDNIFVGDRDGLTDFVKVVDFGIAKVAPVEGNLDGPRLTRVGSVFGTPEYMAPEQASGRSDLDQRVDVYALGTIFYEMVVGHVPHRADSLVAVLAMQILDPIEPPHKAAPKLEIDPGIEAVIMTALAKDRDSRFMTMAEFYDALQAAAAEAGVFLDDPSRSTGALRALGHDSHPPPTAGNRTPPGLAPTQRTPPGPSSPPVVAALPTPPITVRDPNIANALPTMPQAQPAPPRTAGAEDRTYVPDPEMLSPFRAALGMGGQPATVREAKTPAPPPSPTPAPPAPRGPEAPTVMPPQSMPVTGQQTVTPPPAVREKVPVVQPPAPRPIPPPPTSDKYAEPLWKDRPEGVSPLGRWLLLLLLVATSAVVVFVLLRPNQDEPKPVAILPDAAPVAVAATPDAAPAVVVPPPEGKPDAGARVVTPREPREPRVRPDAGVRTTPRLPVEGNGPPVNVRVISSPRGGELATGSTRGLSDGTTFTRPRGTHLLVECSAPQHRPTTVTVIFDGSTREIVCPMERYVKCAKELKNPFDPCPE